MPEPSHILLERFRKNFGTDIDLTLRPAYLDLLARFGNPQDHLPPVFHVAGTNGKGSTCAFLRAMLEAEGYTTHVYTSPHLVTFYERIRIAGKLIEEEELAGILAEAEKLMPPGAITLFEITTIAAFVAFARHKADFTILETGMGGRLDATNVVKKPLATIITRLSYDHIQHLGSTIDAIAREKAGIMRAGVPCFSAAQPERLALQTLIDAAVKKNAPLSVGGADWGVEERGAGFRFTDATRSLDLPPPALLGRHQYKNAGLAIAALSVLPQPLPKATIAQGLRTVNWPARLQHLTTGNLAALIPANAELWLDGGHNDSAGEILASQIKLWRKEDGAQPRPLYIVIGMLTTKRPAEFLSPFASDIEQLRAVPIPNEVLSFSAPALADEARKLGITSVGIAENVTEALRDLASQNFSVAPRIMICGSLYLAGIVLRLSQTYPGI
jgi:dihydrofolate synthase/folylpolyglutamate synthase